MIGTILNTLSHRAKLFRKQWRRTNARQKGTIYSPMHRILIHFGGHLALFVSTVFGVCLALTVLCLALPRYTGFVLGSAKDSDALPYFTGLWSIQATLVALVYPIVFAFVAVSLQQRSTAKLGLRVYLIDSGALVSGTASICLLVWMSVQYLAVPYSPADIVASFIAGDAAWFLLNSILIGIFLYRTVLFLSDPERLRALSRYAVQVALPREMTDRLPAQILLVAAENGWLPPLGSNEEGAQPKISWFKSGHDEPCVVKHGRRGYRIIDVRLRTLYWAIRMWQHQVAKLCAHGPRTTDPFEGERSRPLLMLPILPETLASARTAICIVRNAPPPNWLAARLFRISVVLGKEKTQDDNSDTVAVLTELIAEVIFLLGNRQTDAAIELVKHVVDVHATLLNACAFTNPKGEPEHVGFLNDGSYFRTIHERWVEEYRSLAAAAITELTTDSRFFERYCYLPGRLLGRLEAQPLDVLKATLHIATHLVYRMSIWWSEKVEERGFLEHDPVVAVKLPPPLAGVYERRLRDFVGAWAGLSISERLQSDATIDSAWRQLVTEAKFNLIHLEESATLLLSAVGRGDAVAAGWFADSLLKWWGPSRMTDLYSEHWADPGSLSVKHLEGSWEEARRAFSYIPDDEITIAVVRAAAVSIQKRYAMALRLLCALILLGWSKQGVGESFAAQTALVLLRAEELHPGGMIETEPLNSVGRVFGLLFCVHCGDAVLEGRLNQFAERAQDFQSPAMVPGRGYTWSGSRDMTALMTEQAILLCAVATPRFSLSASVKSAIAEIERDLDAVADVKRWILRLREIVSESDFETRELIVAWARSQMGISGAYEEGRTYLLALLETMLQKLDGAEQLAITNAKVAVARVAELSAIVSAEFSKPQRIFPFSLAPKLAANELRVANRTGRILGQSIAGLTDPILSRVSGESLEGHCRIVVDWVARDILRRYRTSEAIELPLDSSDAFFAALHAHAQVIRAGGGKPALLLSSQLPLWSYPSRHLNGGLPAVTDCHARPRNIDDPKSVIGHFNGVVVHEAPIAPGAIVVDQNHFMTLRCREFSPGRKLFLEAATTISGTVNLRFHWCFLATT